LTSAILGSTARDIIKDAFLKAGIVPAEQPLEPYEIERGLRALNLIIKQWQAQDLHLWSITEAVIPLVVGQRQYRLGPGGDAIANADDFFYTNTEADQVTGDTVISLFDVSGINTPPFILSYSPTDSTQDWTPTDAALGSDGTRLTVTNSTTSEGSAAYSLATTVGSEYIIQLEYEQGTSASCTFSVISGDVLDTVTLSATGSGELRFTANSDVITFEIKNTSVASGEDSVALSVFYFDIGAGSKIGIQLDDGTRQWTQCISKDDVADPPTIIISDDLASDAATGNIVYAYTTDIDRPMRVTSTRFSSFVTSSEIPTNQWARGEYFDQPDKDSQGTVLQWYYDPQLSQGALYVWQVAGNVNNVLRFTYIRPLQISTELLDATDIPSEWDNPLVWNLAKELTIEYPVSDGRYARIDERATNTLNAVLEFDMEDSYMWLQPDRTGY
jgi:hypothetical protein